MASSENFGYMTAHNISFEWLPAGKNYRELPICTMDGFYEGKHQTVRPVLTTTIVRLFVC